jgi:dCMP deaminase
VIVVISKIKYAHLGIPILWEFVTRWPNFVRDNRIIVSSYNSFPPNCPDNIIPNSRGIDGSNIKLRFINHAEMAGILFAASEGISLKGCTLFCQGHPCSNCSRALVTCGVTHWIIGNKPYKADEQEKLLRNFWVEVGKVKIEYIDLENQNEKSKK